MKPTSVPPKTLSQSILSTAYSFIPSSITGWDGVALTSADFGTRAFGAFMNSSKTILELFEYDPTTIASSSITILYRGLKFTGEQTTEVTANKKDWSAFDTIILLGADTPQFLDLFVAQTGDETITGIKTFSSSPIVPTPTTGTQAANKAYADGLAIAGAPDSTTSTKGIGRVSVPPVSAAIPIFVGDNDGRVPTQAENDAMVGTGTPSSTDPYLNVSTVLGIISPYAGFIAPTGWLLCDGSAVSRVTYAGLFGLINPSLGTVTMTLASPAVVSLLSHGLVLDDIIYFTTTGALPTGVAINTRYYIISTGLTADAFQFSATKGGVAINSSVSQSGVHTLRRSPYGVGDGTTTFNIPNLKGSVIVGRDSTQTEFNTVGETGGAKTHTLDTTEIPSHSHTTTAFSPSGTGGNSPAWTTSNIAGTTAVTNSSTGGGGAHNNLQPYITLNYIIKA